MISSCSLRIWPPPRTPVSAMRCRTPSTTSRTTTACGSRPADHQSPLEPPRCVPRDQERPEGERPMSRPAVIYDEQIAYMESKPDSPGGMRLARARYLFEFLVDRGTWYGCRDWNSLDAEVKAALHD